MAIKIKLTRPELKRFRDALHRFERYLPMLKLKQQQLQISMRQVDQQRKEAFRAIQAAKEKFDSYRQILSDTAGVDVESLAKPKEVRTDTINIAGVNVPIFKEVLFAKATYSFFSTPAWVDRALLDLCEVNRCQVRMDVIDQQYKLLQRELTKITQRVNLFEKVKIPEAREVIRVIRIKLGDEMTAAVGRAKIAKAKLSESETFGGMDEEHDNQPE
jgi:V/A-type H+-transporting ATPase subunit D